MVAAIARATATIAAGITVLIVAFLLLESLPALRAVGPLRFLTDPSWNPVHGAYNVVPMLVGTLDIHAGCITALVGPSGCGKTSFLGCINRLTDLIPEARVSGELRLGDVDLLDPRLDVIALRRRVSMVFQKPIPFPLSIRRNLDLPLEEHGMRSRRRRDDAIERVLRDVGLWDEVKDRLESPKEELTAA